MNHTAIDLTIIGAGAAGIAAGRAAQAAGIAYVIVEAMPRVGGRAYTDTASLGVAWDHGCHWLHSASRNPLRPFADALGLYYRRAPSRYALFVGDRWASDAERDEMIDEYGDLLSRAAQLGETQDGSIASLMNPASRWYPMQRTWLMQSYAMEPEAISLSDHARYEMHDTHENWPLREGYGTLLVKLAADLNISLNTAVTHIHWDGSGVRIETTQGTIQSKAVIITASTSVLAADVIRFTPELPAWKREAIAAAPLGFNNKVALRFERDPLGEFGDGTYMITNDGDGTGFWVHPFGQPVVISILGGNLCEALGREGREASLAYVRERLVSVFGGEIMRHVAQVDYAMWTTEPTIRGSYSICRPGEGHRRADLALPVADRLFFAGEATSLNDFSTAHGAFQSGLDAVESVRRLMPSRQA